jgi:hypothetical protein
MYDFFFRGTALRNRAVWSGAVRWPCCCIYSWSCKHPDTGRWLLRKAEALRVSGITLMAHNCHRTTCSSHAGLRHNGGRPAPKRRYIWCISELHPYNVEKWAASRWNHRQLKIGRWQLDLWQALIGFDITRKLLKKKKEEMKLKVYNRYIYTIGCTFISEITMSVLLSVYRNTL